MQSSSPHQRAPGGDAGSAMPPSAQSGVAGRGSKQACAAVDEAAGGDGFAEKRLEAYAAKHEAKHGQQPQQQQQQSPQSSSPSRAAGSNISPDKHIGQLSCASLAVLNDFGPCPWCLQRLLHKWIEGVQFACEQTLGV